MKASPYPRSYYKCSHPGCQVKKIVERNPENGMVSKASSKVAWQPVRSLTLRTLLQIMLCYIYCLYIMRDAASLTAPAHQRSPVDVKGVLCMQGIHSHAKPGPMPGLGFSGRGRYQTRGGRSLQVMAGIWTILLAITCPERRLLTAAVHDAPKIAAILTTFAIRG